MILKNYFLKQGWVEKPLENLKVECGLNISTDSISAVFSVTEPSIRAVNSGFNQPVWQDSCVELFLSLDKKNYYNFEINCIGSILAQHGENRHNRNFIDFQVLELIKVSSTLGNKPFGVKERVTSYQIKVSIPKEVFIFDENHDLINISGNIYNVPTFHQPLTTCIYLK